MSAAKPKVKAMGKATFIGKAVLALATSAQGQGFPEKPERMIERIFFYLGIGDMAIRENPAKRATELLKKVFAK